ncbi:hypothetical protein ZWY2020_048643 [Hordeum vulgare]|nr:hypothetical protein ZWY2020_048643 [Hordeum vulgare]
MEDGGRLPRLGRGSTASRRCPWPSTPTSPAVQTASFDPFVGGFIALVGAHRRPFSASPVTADPSSGDPRTATPQAHRTTGHPAIVLALLNHHQQARRRPNPAATAAHGTRQQAAHSTPPRLRAMAQASITDWSITASTCSSKVLFQDVTMARSSLLLPRNVRIVSMLKTLK